MDRREKQGGVVKWALVCKNVPSMTNGSCITRHINQLQIQKNYNRQNHLRNKMQIKSCVGLKGKYFISQHRSWYVYILKIFL